jgi:hypothetical protein
VPAATLPQLVAPDANVGTTQTWQLFAGLSAPFEKHTPPMRQKPSSIRPLQSLSTPSHTSAESVAHTGRVAVIVKFAHVVGADTRYRRTHTVSGHAVVRVRKPVETTDTLSTNTHCDRVIPHDALAAQLVRTSIRIDGSLDVRLTRGEPAPRSSVPDGYVAGIVTVNQRSLPTAAGTYALVVSVPVGDSVPRLVAVAHVSAGPLSTTPLQSSSMALHVSVDGERITVSEGHSAAEPVQVSAGSQIATVADGRHTVLAGRNAFVGHATPAPSQASATSHTPAEARHTVPATERASAGQAGATPVQASSGSHTPAEARHTVPADESTLLGQAAAVPVQLSAGSHTPAVARHTVLAGRKLSAGHAPVLVLPMTAVPPAIQFHAAPPGHTVVVAMRRIVVVPAGCDANVYDGVSVRGLMPDPPVNP